MPNLNSNFQGSQLIIPSAYYADDVSAALPALPPPTPPLICVGWGAGPKPQTINKYSSTQDMYNALRGGNFAGFMPFIASPSPQLNGAQNLVFIDASNNTQGTITLNTTGATGFIIASSSQYGLPSNLLQIGIAAGSVAVANPSNSQALTARKITVLDGYSGAQFVGDNIGVPFQVAYTGVATSGLSYTTTVTGAAGTATVFTVTSPRAGETFAVPLGAGNYAQIQDVVEYLNGTGFWIAQTLTDSTLPSNFLDAAASVAMTAPTSGGVLTYAFTTATLGDTLYWLNNRTSGFISAVASGTPASPNSIALIPLTHFAGATSIPPVASGYAAAFNLSNTTPGWAIISDSTAPAVQQLGTQAALLSSQPGVGAWRRFVGGSALGDSVTTSIVNATALDAIEGTYVYPGISRADPGTGVVISRPGIYAAAAVAAMMTGNGANVALTRKALTAAGIEATLTITQVDQLQQAGVMPIAVLDQSGIPRVVSDFTTWQVDSNPENVFNQQVAERFWTAYSMVNALNPYVGTTADPFDEMKILNATKAMLNFLTYSPGNPTGTIDSWDSDSLSLTYTGSNQTAAIRVNVVLVGQNRFITIFVPIQPLNITISASSS